MKIKRIQNLLSPLRIIGGKSKVLPALHSHLPAGIEEYRECFIGAGSMALSIMFLNKDIKYWINDGNPNTFNFWKNLHEHPAAMFKFVAEKRKEYPTTASCRELYDWCKAGIEDASSFENGCMWFLLNRITFSGNGVFTGDFHFNENSIWKIKSTGQLMRSVDLRITNLDYSALFSSSEKNVFIFADPPYSLGNRYLYGKLHKNFCHDSFAKVYSMSPHKTLVTYNDIPEIRNRFPASQTQNFIVPYGTGKKRMGNELIIKNY